MGCKQSKAVRVQPVGAAEMKRGKDMDQTTDNRTRKHSKRSNSRHSLGSLDGDSLGPDDRQGSAGSKKSNDSGLDLGEENHGFITEYSDPEKRRTVEEGFQERDDLELGITGVQLPTRNSAKDKARLEESLVMQKLREEGLISKTTAEYKGGVTFDIVDMKMSMSSKLPSLPPLKLASLEKRRKKKKNLTEEEIEEKLRKAEARRKRKEQARLEKIKDLDKADQAAALSSFADYQKKKEEQNVQKLESADNNRERLLNERREKQLERERRREEVRKRKAELKALGLTTENGEIINDASELLDRQSTPQVPE